MKIVISTIYLFLFISNSYGQLSFGLKGGISIPDLKAPNDGNPLSEGWKSRQGPYFGLVGNLMLTNKLGFQTELNYSSQGGKKDGKQAIPVNQFVNPVPDGFPKYVYANYKSEAKINYIELPVMLKLNFTFAKIFSFFVQGGPYGGYLLSAKNASSGSSYIYLDKEETTQALPYKFSFDSTISIKDQLNKFNFGIQGGIGFSLKTPAGALLLTAGGNYGLTTIQKDPENGKNHTGAATITLGYVFNL